MSRMLGTLDIGCRECGATYGRGERHRCAVEPHFAADSVCDYCGRVRVSVRAEVHGGSVAWLCDACRARRDRRATDPLAERAS